MQWVFPAVPLARAMLLAQPRWCHERPGCEEDDGAGPALPSQHPCCLPTSSHSLLRRGCGRDQQAVVTCCHKHWGWEEGRARAVGLLVRAGVGRGRVQPVAGAVRAGEAPAGTGARCGAARRGAILGRAAMGTKPPYGEINSWTFWPGFCRTNLAGTRGN